MILLSGGEAVSVVSNLVKHCTGGTKTSDVPPVLNAVCVSATEMLKKIKYFNFIDTCFYISKISIFFW